LKLSSSNNFFDVYDFDNVSLLDDDSASLWFWLCISFRWWQC
jgi:hypothetical protein